MIPKIEFRYSGIYDGKYRNSKQTQKYLKEKNQDYPSKEKILKYIKSIEKLWEKCREETLKEISKISGLKWKEKKIICYVIGCGRPFSDPLTIRTYGKDVKRFVETLIHELIHQIQIQNKKECEKWHKYISKKYSKEKRITRKHILLSAIHWKFLEKFYGRKGINEEIKKYDKSRDYKKAWKIVEKECADNIIKKFKGVIK